MEEIWKDIFGYEGLYQVNNCGYIKSLPKIINPPNGGKGITKEKILKNTFDKDGYFFVQLSKNGKLSPKKVHRLVALTFVPNPENKPQVNHKDGNKQNNNIDNLEWNTKKENIKHAHENGLINRKGVKNSQSKLTEQQVLEIRELYSNGKYSSRQLAKEYGMNKSSISSVINRKTWKHM
jgi:hypothetical protein